MKPATTPMPRRRRPILLEQLEGRLLFDAAPLDPAVQANLPVTTPSVSDSARALDSTAGSQNASPQAALSAVSAEQAEDASQRPLAFPGAAGMGAYARGGRGGDVFHVTSLDDHGPGTLREGLRSATGPRTIVFDVSGTIELSRALVVDDPYLTIAGQTAPGDGVTLKNHGLSILNTHDIIVRYLRLRPGDTHPHEEDALLVYSSHDVMIDHVSATWAVDEIMDTSKSDNVTVQWSILGEALHDSSHHKGPHSMGSIHTGGGISLHHNLFVGNNRRNPLVRQEADVVNNVMYNWGTHGTIVGWPGPAPDPHGMTQVNLQGNYYVAGPSTTQRYATLPYLGHANSQLWQSDNLLDANRNGLRDGEPLTAFLGSSVMVDSRFGYPSVPADDPLTAYHRVLDQAGASLSRDAVDQRLVQEVIDESGTIVDSQDEVGGWPVLQGEPAARDSDGDGMPDAWEDEQSHLNSFHAADGNHDSNGDGFTHLEDYLAVVAAGDPVLGIHGPRTADLGEEVTLTWTTFNPHFHPSPSDTFEIDWDGDGQVGQVQHGQLGAPVRHVFDRAGQHEVTVTWTGATGQKSHASHRLQVVSPVPVPEIDILAPRQVLAGQPARLTTVATSGSTGNAQPYTFDIDWNSDGKTDQRVQGPLGLDVQHTFDEPGTHVVEVVLTDARGLRAKSTIILEVISPAPPHEPPTDKPDTDGHNPVHKAKIQIEGSHILEAGQVSKFTLTAPQASLEPEQDYLFAIDWLGDGSVDQVVEGGWGTEVEHVFDHWGKYNVRVKLLDQQGVELASGHSQVVVTSGWSEPADAPTTASPADRTNSSASPTNRAKSSLAQLLKTGPVAGSTYQLSLRNADPGRLSDPVVGDEANDGPLPVPSIQDSPNLLQTSPGTDDDADQQEMSDIGDQGLPRPGSNRLAPQRPTYDAWHGDGHQFDSAQDSSPVSHPPSHFVADPVGRLSSGNESIDALPSLDAEEPLTDAEFDQSELIWAFTPKPAMDDAVDTTDTAEAEIDDAQEAADGGDGEPTSQAPPPAEIGAAQQAEEDSRVASRDSGDSQTPRDTPHP